MDESGGHAWWKRESGGESGEFRMRAVSRDDRLSTLATKGTII